MTNHKPACKTQSVWFARFLNLHLLNLHLIKLTFWLCITSVYSFAGNTLAASTSNSSTLVLRVAAEPYIVSYYESVAHSQPCHNIPHTDEPLPRPIYDMLIMCRALHLGGLTFDMQFILVPNYDSALKSVREGTADIAAESIWREDLTNNNYLISSAVIDEYQFEKGFYTLANHPIHKQDITQIDLNTLRGVTVREWVKDLTVLQSVTNNIFTTFKFKAIFTTLSKGHADYTILRIEGDQDFAFTFEGLKIRAIKGFKIALTGTRHFVISQLSESKNTLLSALNNGIYQMKESGELEQHLARMAIKNPRTVNWHILNKDKQGKSMATLKSQR